MDKVMGRKKGIWVLFVFVLISFAAVSLFWMIKYWNYMPMVDESATFSAVNNLMKEGLPRVGVSKESVMYDRPVKGHYYWVYLLECILRVPMQFLGNLCGWNNIQAVTNMLYLTGILIVMYHILRQWVFEDYEERKKYVFTVSLVLLAVACSSGLMCLVHYVRYYSMAMMTFILSLILIPVLLTATDKSNAIKAILAGIAPSLFHMSYVPYFLVIVIVTLWNEKSSNRLSTKKIVCLGSIMAAVGLAGGGYILCVGHNDLRELLSVNGDTIKTYIQHVISLNGADIAVALISIAVVMFFYRRLPAPIQKLLQIVVLNLLVYSVVLSNEKYDSARYAFSLRICYLTIVGIAVYVLSDILMKYAAQYRIIPYAFCTLAIVLWGIFNKGNLSDYPGLTLVPWSEYFWIENELENYDYDEVIVFTDCQMPISIKHPEWYVFSLRDYNSLENVGEVGFTGSVNYYKMSNGFHATTFNQVYGGKKEDLQRILDKFCNDDAVIVFWNSNPWLAEEPVAGFFESHALEKSVIKIDDFKKLWDDYFENKDLSIAESE